MKGGLRNDTGIGVLVDNHTTLHFAGSDILNLLPNLVEEGVRRPQMVGMQRRAKQ